MSLILLLKSSAPAGTATSDRFEVQRSTDGGTTWVAVRTADGDDGVLDTGVPGSVAIYDYEAPNGTSAMYRARALHDYSGVFAASAWTSTASAAWTSAAYWVKDPLRPSRNLALPGFPAAGVKSYGDRQRAARQGQFQAMGATLPIVVSDTRGGATGTLVLQLSSLADRNALDVLLNQLATLLVQGPVSHGHPDRYVRFGDQGTARLVDIGSIPYTLETLAWTQVATPAGAQGT